MQLNNNNKTLIIMFIGIAIFFIVVLPNIECYFYKTKKEDTDYMTNTLSEPLKVSEKICSESCCNYTQWTPLNPDLQMYAHNPNSPYVPSNYTCNQGNNTGRGCPCLTKEDYKYLTNKGGNGSNCF
jgi:hypothetical protein